MEEVLNALQEVCSTLEDVRDTATFLTTHLRLQKAKKRLMTLTLEMEEDMKANQRMLKQNKSNKLKALILMSDKFKKQVTEHVETQEELLRLAAELSHFTGDRVTAKNRFAAMP